MQLSTRKLLDRVFTAAGLFAILIMLAALGIIMIPIFQKGAGAFCFRATIEHRKQMLALFQRGNPETLRREERLAESARQPVYDMLESFRRGQSAELDRLGRTLEKIAAESFVGDRHLQQMIAKSLSPADIQTRAGLAGRAARRAIAKAVPGAIARLEQAAGAAEHIAELSVNAEMLADCLRELLGPLPGDPLRLMPRRQFGQARWDRALVKLNQLLYIKTWDYSRPGKIGAVVYQPRKDQFAGTPLQGLADYVENNLAAMLRPRRTFYWRFLTDKSVDIHFFGGIGPELLGTLYLTLGAMLFAGPLGIMAAVYFAEYAKQGRIISLLRSCVSTLAGVPSIVFGLFGLAFFINTLHVSPSKSVLAGALTLGLLILPTMIRAAEEAIMSVPHTYKEAALSLGAGRWRTILTVILPAALPGILTGVVISMGRAAGETAPIIFTAAVSVGLALKPWEVFANPTPALSWNIYNLATEHEAVDEIRHVQFGMVMTLVGLVLLLNLAAIFARARIAARIKG